MYHIPTRRCQKRQSERIARVNAPESALAAPSTPQCHNIETQNLPHHQRNRCAYLCNGAFTFALRDFFIGRSAPRAGRRGRRPLSHPTTASPGRARRDRHASRRRLLLRVAVRGDAQRREWPVVGDSARRDDHHQVGAPGRRARLAVPRRTCTTVSVAGAPRAQNASLNSGCRNPAVQ